MSMTGTMSVSTCSTANCPSGVAATSSTPRLAASCSCAVARPHRFWARDTSARLLLIAVPGGIEDYFDQINNASDDVERHRIGELYGIRVVPG